MESRDEKLRIPKSCNQHRCETDTSSRSPPFYIGNAVCVMTSLKSCENPNFSQIDFFFNETNSTF